MSNNTNTNSCDSTCVGLAVGLGILFFLIGILVLWYFKDKLAPPEEDIKKAKGPAEPHDIETGDATLPPPPPRDPLLEKPLPPGTTIKRRRSSNNEQAVNLALGSDNARPVSLSQSEPSRKKLTSNNDQQIDASDVSGRKRRSNNEKFVDALEVSTSSANEPKVDAGAVQSGSGKLLRGRRTSSNNDRPVDAFEVQHGPPPTEAEVEAARKRAASLERRLEEVSKTHSSLVETSKKLQQEITELSAKNHEMMLDKS